MADDDPCRCFLQRGGGCLCRRQDGAPCRPREPTFDTQLSEAEWYCRLGWEQFGILRMRLTEEPRSSPLYLENRPGVYSCAGCDLAIFSSSTKFESGTGWPSFWRACPGSIVTKPDLSFRIPRTEVCCRRCGSHLGHLFRDGPPPTGLRYCINGLALNFSPARAGFPVVCLPAQNGGVKRR